MKALHRSDLFGWSRFDEPRDLDFNSLVWVRPGGNVVIDPLPLSAHDEAHLKKLGGAAWIVITNSEHVRDAARLREVLGAKIAGPIAERSAFPLPCDAWLANAEHVVPGMRVVELQGSKTPGELALLLEETTLITGDLIRGQRGGSLNLLPDPKLKDKAAALASVKKLAEEHPRIEAVLVGDGWPVFRDGRARLMELAP
jgi:glyoxylase-like metal-dependent hydrolase (beta-lactamase superfamily II)